MAAMEAAEEAKLLEELRNYSQHKFLPYLNPAWQFSQSMPMAEYQFGLHVDPLSRRTPPTRSTAEAGRTRRPCAA
jgi:hypothetical protein